jgi:hypothetical protein
MTFQKLTVINGARCVGARHVIGYAYDAGKNGCSAMLEKHDALRFRIIFLDSFVHGLARRFIPNNLFENLRSRRQVGNGEAGVFTGGVSAILVGDWYACFVAIKKGRTVNNRI